MKRSYCIVLALAMILSFFPPVSQAQEDIDCNPDLNEPFACRAFEASSISADVIFLQITVSEHPSTALAESYVLDMSEEMEEESLPLLRMRGLPDGTEYLYTNVVLEDDDTSMGFAFVWVSFQHYVITLAAIGNDTSNTGDLVAIITDMIERAEASDADLLGILPSASDLPIAMSQTSENATASRSNSTSASDSSNKVTRKPRSSSDSTKPLSSEGVTRTPRKTSTSSSSGSTSSSSSSTTRSSTSSGGLQVTDVSSRDAGIGDGTLYVYIELENNSSRSYDYVQVDIVCRDRNDRVVATGLANELGLPAGGSTVLTGIVMSAPDCVRIQTQINPLSN